MGRTLGKESCFMCFYKIERRESEKENKFVCDGNVCNILCNMYHILCSFIGISIELTIDRKIERI